MSENEGINYTEETEKTRIPSILGRLLYEISWEGNATKNYRMGGEGRENVLTADVLQILDYLPRKYFLGPVINAMHEAESTRKIIVSEIEKATLDMLPFSVLLRPSEKSWQKQCAVQPDGFLESPSVYCFIEIKRLRTTQFMERQLARELVATVVMAKEKAPLLMLIVPKKPPFSVKHNGKLLISEAVDLYIDEVVNSEVQGCEISADVFRNLVSNVICWITWDELLLCIKRQLDLFLNESESVQYSVKRMVNKLDSVIEWHR